MMPNYHLQKDQLPLIWRVQYSVRLPVPNKVASGIVSGHMSTCSIICCCHVHLLDKTFSLSKISVFLLSNWPIYDFFRKFSTDVVLKGLNRECYEKKALQISQLYENNFGENLLTQRGSENIFNLKTADNQTEAVKGRKVNLDEA